MRSSPRCAGITWPAYGPGRRLRRHCPVPGHADHRPERARPGSCKDRQRSILVGTRTLRRASPSPARDPSAVRVPAEPGDDPRRYATAKAPLELRRHQPCHPRSGEEASRPLGLQRPARRRAARPCLQPETPRKSCGSSGPPDSERSTAQRI
jgi:hypothetical protein